MGKSAHWFGQAAEKGNGYAQYRLGGLHEHGRGAEEGLHFPRGC